MRIIAGELGGRRIAAPPGKGTRPMLDRVREALFSSLGERVVDAAVLDLFAGSGSLGLEALSRGAARVRLVEADRKAAKLIRKNLELLGVAERVELVSADALVTSIWGEGKYDLVFLDPPYRMVSQAQTRQRVFEALAHLFEHSLAPGGLAVLHTPRGELQAQDFPERIETSSRRYGSNDLWFLTHAPGAETDPEAPEDPEDPEAEEAPEA